MSKRAANTLYSPQKIYKKILKFQVITWKIEQIIPMSVQMSEGNLSSIKSTAREKFQNCEQQSVKRLQFLKTRPP